MVCPLLLLGLPLFPFPLENWFTLLKGCLPDVTLLLLIILIVRSSKSSAIVTKSSTSISMRLAILPLAPLLSLITSNFMAYLRALMNIAGSFCINVTLMPWLTPIRKHPLEGCRWSLNILCLCSGFAWLWCELGYRHQINHLWVCQFSRWILKFL